MADQERLGALTGLYQEYLADYAHRLEEAGPTRGLQKFLVGNTSATDRKADNHFFKTAEQAVAALSDADGDTAFQAARFMLLESEGFDPSSTLMMEAVQGLALPLIGRLSREDAATLYDGYLARYPKRRMRTPKQQEVFTALERQAK